MDFKKISEDFYQNNFDMSVDFKNKKLSYPKKIKNHDRNNIIDKSHKENFVVFECVHRLLKKGYKPEDITLEKSWLLGHTPKSGRADICISNADGETFCIIECKTFGQEYNKALKKLDEDGGQLFSYWQQERACKWLVLYTSTFDEKEEKIISKSETVDCSDDKNILTAAEKNLEIKTYQNSYTVKNLYETWADTYEKKLLGDLFFNDDTKAYEIGIKLLKISDLEDFKESDGIVNKFEEILRHNNISDYANAFNRLIALFICKLVDESQKNFDDEVDFQYKIGSDSYEILQDRLQRLHRDGMEKFMDEKIFYLPDDYAKNLVHQVLGQDREFMIKDLQSNLRKLKFFTNNDFAFKEVHNEELFYQNGKVLVEMVRLFQKFKIISPNNLQTLGDMFEQLLDKGFKQNEGQFFTPMPITRFIWDSLPLEKIISDEPPKIIDYACGAGHFLTQGFKSVNDFSKNTLPEGWEDRKLFGIEKDYRLARVSRISFFMHGANKGSVIFGDGLENNFDKYIRPADFDILVSNPPYSIKGFKPHLKLENKNFKTLEKVSNEGSEIETLFVERIAQLVKPGGIAAVILPSSILNKDGGSFICAREEILKNFYIRAVVELGSKTFGATGTKTNVIFLEKFEDNPKRFNLLADSVIHIFKNDIRKNIEDHKIFYAWLKKINVTEEIYKNFIHRRLNYNGWKNFIYFDSYFTAFENSAEYRNKISQVTFQNLPDNEKISWLNQKFYEFAHEIEKEKIHYFAMTYTQKTLIISAPDDSKEQEKFLGYTWSNRKGDEGIKIKSEGGLLFDKNNRRAENKLAFAVRKIFFGEEVQIDDAKNYFNYFNLSDLIDFSGTNFTKIISMSKISDEKLILERLFSTQKLEKFVEINIATFDPTKTPEKKFFYVDISAIDSANNLINFSNEIFGKDAPSRARRIANDGDILISTVRPYLKSFAIVKNSPKNTLYSTGFAILNSKNKNILLNEFIFCLFMNDPILMEQIQIKMTKSAYPSINQNDIKNFQILLPTLEEQKKIIGEFTELDEKILQCEEKISASDLAIKNKFSEMFGGIEEKISIGECCEIEKGDNLTREQAIEGKIPVVAGGILPSCYHNVANREKNIISVSASGKNAGYINFWREPIFATDCNTLKNKKNFVIEYIYYALKNIQEKIFELQRGSAQPHVYGEDLKKILIPVPPKEKQEKFAEFVLRAEGEKNSAKNLREKYLLEREELVEKYFR